MLFRLSWVLFLSTFKPAESHGSNILGWTSHYPRTPKSPTETHRFQIQDINEGPAAVKQTLWGDKPQLEMEPLLVSGPSKNRVDLVFLSDGYLLEERDKFVSDALRLAQDVSKNQTFNTVQPLLNFWAAFTPSKESGIGINGVPKNTPYGLYRDGTELRGVYYDNPEVAKAACKYLGDRCDYPILLGNDPLYGGLGGEFTVITASALNGPLVLRHELGHSILDVGEEYDGGEGYFGRNAAHDIHALPWKHWLSDPSRVDHNGDPWVERSVMAMQAYPWTLLNTSKPWAVEFNSSGTYSRHSLQFSLSGLPHQRDLRVSLDGQDLGWMPRPHVGMDRWFYNFHFSEPLMPGKHRLEFELLNHDREGSAQLCSTELLEFGTENEFVSQSGFCGVYPTYNYKNETSYRPTNEGCLMRAVATPNFCKVCTETLWLHLLRKLSFVDAIRESCETSGGSTFKTLSVDLLPLAHLRKTPLAHLAESYSLIWRKGGKVMSEFANKTRIVLEDSHSIGEYSVHVKYSTEEVRLKSSRLESDTYYMIANSCKDLN